MVTKNENSHDGKSGGERIAKVIARSGLCSRREAEALIEEGRVSVNGAVIESAALDILPSDKVQVDGKPLAVREPPRLWRYHKPKGRVTTHKDPEGRPTVFEALPEGLPRLISVGRLDFNTEGLLLLTNDGDLARHLELPSTGWTRRYRVRAHGQISDEQLKELADGVTINRINYGPIEASLQREQGGNVWIAISIREGKNREVRRIMEHLGLTVNRLIRVSFGPFMLGELEPGQIEEVKVSVLKDQLGPRLSRQLGVRREPMREERRLAPGRAKPTYLRRKPGAEERPRRPEPEETPLKRRRVLEMDSSEAPKVEYVAEKKPRPDRFGRGDERGGRPSREGRDERPERAAGERPARREGQSPRGSRYPADRPKFEDRASGAAGRGFGHGSAGRRPFRERVEGEERGSRGERGGSSAGTERPGRDRSGGERVPFAPRLDATTETPGAGRTFRTKPEGEQPRSRFRRDAEAPRGRFEDRKPRERTEDRPRPSFRRDGEAPRGRFEDRKPREPTEERPRPSFRRDGEGPRGGFEDRKPRERTEERPRPSFRRDAEGPRGGSEERKPRERTGERPRPSFRSDAEGPRGGFEDRKPRERTGERPRPSFRRDAEGPRSGFEDRKPRERTGERPRPAFRRDAEGPRGGSEDRKPRERTEERPRPSFRRDAEGPRGAPGDRKPGERTSNWSGGKKPLGKRAEGKPFRSGGKGPHKGPGSGPRKPRPGHGPHRKKP